MKLRVSWKWFAIFLVSMMVYCNTSRAEENSDLDQLMEKLSTVNSLTPQEGVLLRLIDMGPAAAPAVRPALQLLKTKLSRQQSAIAGLVLATGDAGQQELHKAVADGIITQATADQLTEQSRFAAEMIDQIPALSRAEVVKYNGKIANSKTAAESKIFESLQSEDPKRREFALNLLQHQDLPERVLRAALSKVTPGEKSDERAFALIQMQSDEKLVDELAPAILQKALISNNELFRKSAAGFCADHPTRDPEIIKILMRGVNGSGQSYERAVYVRAVARSKGTEAEVLQFLARYPEQQEMSQYFLEGFRFKVSEMISPRRGEPQDPRLDYFAKNAGAVLDDPQSQKWAKDYVYEQLCSNAPGTIAAFDRFLHTPHFNENFGKDALLNCMNSGRSDVSTYVINALTKGSPADQSKVLEALARCDRNGNPILQAMIDQGGVLRDEAVAVISENDWARRKLGITVCKLITDPSEKVRLAAVKCAKFSAMSRSSPGFDVDSVNTIVTGINDSSGNVRLAALDAAPSFHNEIKVNDALVTVLTNTDPALRAEALKQIESIAPFGLPLSPAVQSNLKASLLPLVNDPAPDVRGRAEKVWNYLRLGPFPPPPIPFIVRFVIGALAALIAALFVSALIGALHLPDVGQVWENPNLAARWAGGFLVVASVLLLLNAIFLFVRERRAFWLPDIEPFELSALLFAAGLAVAAWGAAMFSTRRSPTVLIGFYVTTIFILSVLFLMVIGTGMLILTSVITGNALIDNSAPLIISIGGFGLCIWTLVHSAKPIKPPTLPFAQEAV